MKKGWIVKKLREVCESDLGKTINKSKDKGRFYPYLCSINVLWNAFDFSTIKEAKFEETELDKYSVSKGDLLICEGGDIGRAAIWNFDNTILYQNALHRVRCYDNLNSMFCLYYLKYLKEKGILDSKYAKGVTIKHLVKSALLSIPIPIPPLFEQHRIVSELDCLNGIINKKREQLKELDALAQSIFYDMFGDPDHTVYEVVALSNLTKYKLSYGSGASATSYDGNIRYVRITDIGDEGVLLGEKVSPTKVEDKYILNDGDVLFARSGATVGKTFLYESKYGKCIYAGYLIRYVADREKILPKYLFYYTKTLYYKSFIKTNAQAVAQPNINAQQYGNLKVCVPPLSLQQEFAEKISAIDKQKELIKQSLAEVEDLFNSRMDYYFH